MSHQGYVINGDDICFNLWVILHWSLVHYKNKKQYSLRICSFVQITSYVMSSSMSQQQAKIKTVMGNNKTILKIFHARHLLNIP